MSDDTSRRISKSQVHSPEEALELLELIFAAEVLVPSRYLWIVSPWVSDVVVLDNRSGRFDGLDPTWGRRQIRLSEVLAGLVDAGAVVTIVTRRDAHNRAFLDALSNTGAKSDVVLRPELHEKGILGDTFHLSGSMNITYMGIHVNEEALIYTVDPSDVATAQLDYRKRYGQRGDS